MDVERETPPPPLRDALPAFLKIGLLSFGGPAAHIALMHRVLVDEKRWLSERRFLTGLNFCMLLPGPEAMQLVTYAGWRMYGVLGGLAAGLLFILPGALAMLALAIAYAAFGRVPIAEALFLGVKAAVLAIVVEALIRIGRRTLKGSRERLAAAAAFVAMYFFAVPFPVIILTAALVGFFLWVSTDEPVVEEETSPRVPLATTARTIAVWGAIWLVPLALMGGLIGGEHVMSELAWLHAKLAVVTFGGAYAVLTYLAQEAVHTFGWLNPGEMLDALGLAETAPGPLILVTEFVGALAGWRHGGGTPVLMAVAGAIVTLWATFVPCFLWIFAGAPYVDRIASMPRLRSALAAITAAVCGVILNLAVWFALHAVFARTDRIEQGPLQFEVPDFAALRPDAFALSVLAVLLLFVFRRSVVTTLGLTAAAGLALHAVNAGL